MLCKSLPSLILPLHFKRLLAISAPSSSDFQITAKNAEEQEDTSQKGSTFLQSARLTASLGISEDTHDEKTTSTSLFSDALRISAKMGFLPEGKQLHSHAIKSGINHIQSLQNQLLNLYVKCEAFVDAFNLFDEMPKRNVVSWNIMISGLLCCQLCKFSSENLPIFLFRKMLVGMVEPNYITFISVIGACIERNDIEIGKQVHCRTIKSGFYSNAVVGSALVDLYAKSGSVGDARRVFDKIRSRDLVLWNVMVSCYALNGLGREAFAVFELMRCEGMMGDGFTFSSLLNSCSMLGSHELGKQIHGVIIRLSLDLDVLVSSTLVDMYAKNGKIEDARKAFDVMIVRNVVSWTTIVVGYGQKGEGKEAMKLFRRMLLESLKPDELMLASLLSSCATLAALIESVQLHAHVIKDGFDPFVSIGNALISAYSKCGSISSASQCFGLISKPNLVSWTSMICAYAFHGLASKAIEFFENMLHEGVNPDRIAFVGVLSACSHAGLLDEGFHYFGSMRRDHHIIPDLEHYTCMVDLLGRAGHLDEAYNILISMPFKPGANVLGALISACRVHGNTELSEWAADILFKLEPDEPVNYMLMSNIYASVGSWSDVARVRKMMRNSCVNKIPGCSWIEICGKVHTFVSSDKSHTHAV
ncbi:pentatricopeptide repeat (PPR-like) superfamily protein [Tasmannia lanceolata]|uniref:pentatricopeptide repeat (PPR-like) superfamily protein n=1 Tax=Tasmannia lanceolata TaxID=3420 RepID=UPI004062EAE3